MEKKDIDWSNIGFGYYQTDERYVSNFKNGAWDDGVRGASARPPGLSGTRFGCAGMPGRPRSWPSSHCSSTCSVSARNLSVSARGVVLPLTYWLMWLLPSLTPDAWAARTMSTCLR